MLLVRLHAPSPRLRLNLRIRYPKRTSVLISLRTMPPVVQKVTCWSTWHTSFILRCSALRVLAG